MADRLVISTNNFVLQYALIDASDYVNGVKITGLNAKLYNVTIYAPNGVAIDGDETCEIINCILEGGIQDIDITTGKTVTSQNNCLHHHSNSTDNIGLGTLNDTDSIFGQDPLFTDSTTGDFTLQSTSPCIEKGVNLHIVSSDIDGNHVPQYVGNDPEILVEDGRPLNIEDHFEDT